MHPNKRIRRFTATFNLYSVDIYPITTSDEYPFLSDDHVENLTSIHDNIKFF